MLEFNTRQENTYYVDRKLIAKMVNGVFGWMFLGIMVTALTVLGVFTSEAMVSIIIKGYIPIIIGQFAITFAIGFFINNISLNVTRFLYLLYAVLTGLIFSVAALYFTPQSVLFCLTLTSLIFGVMAIYGYVTKEDLSKFGPLLSVGLIVMIIGGVLNMFLRLPMMSLIIAYIGVLIFTALIGYDINRIKAGMTELAMEGSAKEIVQKYSVYGAFQIYLDFVGLFWSLLRIFGRK